MVFSMRKPITLGVDDGKWVNMRHRLARNIGPLVYAAAAIVLSIQSARYDSVNKCMAGTEEVGCVATTSCDDSVAWAIDTQERCFFFTNLCIPSGFTILQFQDTRCPTTVASVPACENRGKVGQRQ